jgi:hypothetical protein
MTTRIRRAWLFVSTLPTVVYAELESQRLQQLASRGVPVAERRVRLERRVAEAIKRIEEEYR